MLTVPPSRLMGSLLLSEQSVAIVAGGIASVLLSAVTENRNFTVFLIPAAIGLAAAYWSSFNKGYNFTAAVSPDGLRLRYGLLDTQAQTVPPGRIQALKVSQPPLWRILGWYRVQVNVAGYGVAGNAGQGSARTTLLPVGSLADVLNLLSLVLPDPGTPDPAAVFTAGITGLAGAAEPPDRHPQEPQRPGQRCPEPSRRRPETASTPTAASSPRRAGPGSSRRWAGGATASRQPRQRCS